MYKIEDFAMMIPMRYYNNENDCPKRQEILENKDGKFIASEKHDGCWSMLIHKTKGDNLIRSRSISKVTGVYGDYTAKVPHIVEEMDKWPDNTVILAELCWDQYGTNANTVGTILRCLPAKAVERQKEQKLSAIGFDCLMINGEDFCAEPYMKRLFKLKCLVENYPNPYIKITDVFMENFREEADRIISEGGEGCVIQRMDNPYMPGTRTAWKTLKLKQQLPEMELKVIGVLEPNKIYEGDCIDSWKYWEVDTGLVFATIPAQPAYELKQTEGGKSPLWDRKKYSYCPVTKPYFMHWKNGITVELPDGNKTDVASGLTDADREWLATEEAAKMIANGELYAVVKAMSFNDLGKLRHPSLVRLRNDL